MARVLRFVALAAAIGGIAAAPVNAQPPPLVFTVAVPDRASSETTVRASAVVEARGLALWSGAASDFGTGVDIAGPTWTVRSITSMTMLRVGDRVRPSFQQIGVGRPLFFVGSASVAGGGGIRQEWDGTRVLVGRVLSGADLGRGRLQGSLVLERALASTMRRDAADVVISVGWTRRLGNRLAVGVEGIGQDLEGFWDAEEAEGGARLLVGPSLHFQSKNGDWSSSVVVGPVLRSSSTVLPTSINASHLDAGRHLGFFASASWLPSKHGTRHDLR